MSIELREVTRSRQLKQFVGFPYKLYKGNKYWVPPLLRGELETLSRRSNPAYEHCDATYLMAFRNGEPVGRIAGIINHRYIEEWEKKDMRFCWFEAVDDREVFESLLGAAMEWGKSRGMERIVGPMGFTTFERQGILVKGFEEMPTFAGVHNPPYYPQYLESLGFGKEIEYVEFELKVPQEVPEKILKIRDLVSERYGLKLMKARSTKEMLPYADPVFRVINEAYKPLYGFTTLTENEIRYFVKKYFSFISPDYTSAVLDEENRVLGFQISMPSLSHALQKARGKLFPFGWYHLQKAMKNPKRLDTLLTGVLPEYQNKGVNSVFMTHLTAAAIRNGIVHAESNSELEENIKMQNIWRYFESRQHRRSRIYSKQIT